jgi:hypothetical protein
MFRDGKKYFFYVLGCHKHKEEGEEEDWIKYWKLNEH